MTKQVKIRATKVVHSGPVAISATISKEKIDTTIKVGSSDKKNVTSKEVK